MSKHDRITVVKDLKVLLANTYMIYLKTQNFHWNYAGKEFYSLHILFEKQYQELAEAVDEIAERIRALDSFVEASFSHFKQLSSISEEDELRPAPDMIKELIRSHDLLLAHARSFLSVADQVRDGATADLLARRLGTHEKMLWMLKSSISM